MKDRSTLYLDRNVISFLLSKGENVSQIAGDSLLTRALELGYANIENQIKALESKLSLLRKIRKTKITQDSLNERFFLMFRGYLDQQPREIHQIRAWLLGPGNKEYSSIVGHPQNLSKEKVEQLIANAYTTAKNPRGV